MKIPDFVKSKAFWTHLLAAGAGIAATLGQDKVVVVINSVLALFGAGQTQ